MFRLEMCFGWSSACSPAFKHSRNPALAAEGSCVSATSIPQGLKPISFLLTLMQAWKACSTLIRLPQKYAYQEFHKMFRIPLRLLFLHRAEPYVQAQANKGYRRYRLRNGLIRVMRQLDPVLAEAGDQPQRCADHAADCATRH